MQFASDVIAAAQKMPLVRVGARGSKLSTTQTLWLRQRLFQAIHGVAATDLAELDAKVPLTIITTTGDRIQDRRLLEAGGKQLFTKEIEEALLAGEIDLAVHSLKDVPAVQPEGLCIGAFPVREDPRDAFLSLKAKTLMDLPVGAKLGTASLRRQAQALRARPDLKVEMLRGNVDTRLRRLKDGDFDAILLAASGLHRLGLQAEITSYLDPRENAPAPGQGALAVQCRVGDKDAYWFKTLHCTDTALQVAAERGALESLEGSCKTAIGSHATIEDVADGRVMTVRTEALSGDGQSTWKEVDQLSLSDDPNADLLTARALGLLQGDKIRARAGDRLIAISEH